MVDSELSAEFQILSLEGGLPTVKNIRESFLIFIILCLCTLSYGSGLSITNLRRGTYDYGSGNVELKFDVSWTGSWRTSTAPGNWDAVWLFVKYRVGGGAWQHARLNNSGHVAPSGTTLTTGLIDTSAPFNIVANPVVGAFIYRSSNGAGTLTLSDVVLNWNYASNGVVSGNAVDVKVYGIEMAYVPQGAFYAGDNATGDRAFKQGSSDSDPWYISSENAFSVTNSAGNGTGSGQTAGIYYIVSGDGGDATGSAFTVPAEYPKGYGGFYVMKGEISQGEWVSFFNTLDTTQKATRDITSNTNGGKNTDSISYRNNVSWSSGDAALPGGSTNYSGVAANYLSWGDLIAYLDWAGLRPMSELEYEKAGRGPTAAVSGEYGWGSTSITGATSISSGGQASERGQTGSNITYNNAGGVQGPTRVGSYGGGVNTRVASGASYYGIFDLSGNLWERPVTVGNSTGRSFQSNRHGDGNLDTTGEANQSSWPTTSATGAGFRGGTWYDYASYARLSDRFYAAFVNGYRDINYSGRGARFSAP
jgi:formylglycine-generating enzyme required for sulfatase activity